MDYCTWLDGHNPDLFAVRRVHVDGYRHTLMGASSTVATTLAALSSFYRYAMTEDVTHPNPVQTVTRPRADTDHLHSVPRKAY
jgi:site-specific recombinase XerD